MENIDMNFAVPALLNRQQILQKYSAAMQQLRALAQEKFNIRPLYFDNYVLLHYFQQQQQRSSNNNIGFDMSALSMDVLKCIIDRRRRICFWLFYLAMAYMCVLLYRQDNNHLQRLMHPAGMRLWRRITLPFIRRYPRLTELYDESCLMENPFYELQNLNCERCRHVQSIADWTDVSQPEANADKIVPFIFRLQQQQPVSIDELFKLYTTNYEVFRRDAYRLQSSSSSINNLDDFFSLFNQTQQPQQQQQEMHNLWRCNRMLPARLLRQLFMLLPGSGLALERFVAIDTAKAPAYALPKTQCAHAYVQQALGARMIILRPASACRHLCHTLTIRLPPAFVLSYNWWYWKPISAPDPIADSYSLSLIGSYC